MSLHIFEAQLCGKPQHTSCLKWSFISPLKSILQTPVEWPGSGTHSPPPLGLTTFKYVNPLTPHLLFFGPGTLTLIFTDFHTRAILLLLWFWQIVKMAAVLPFTVIMPLACDFEAFPIKKWSLFSHPSNLGWLCDLLWLTECGESDSVPALSLDFKRSIHFYICLFSWTPS